MQRVGSEQATMFALQAATRRPGHVIAVGGAEDQGNGGQVLQRFVAAQCLGMRHHFFQRRQDIVGFPAFEEPAHRHQIVGDAEHVHLMPGFALAYGALLLDEPVTAAALGGLALILAGVALGSGALGERLRRRAAAR